MRKLIDSDSLEEKIRSVFLNHYEIKKHAKLKAHHAKESRRSGVPKEHRFLHDCEYSKYKRKIDAFMNKMLPMLIKQFIKLSTAPFVTGIKFRVDCFEIITRDIIILCRNKPHNVGRYSLVMDMNRRRFLYAYNTINPNQTMGKYILRREWCCNHMHISSDGECCLGAYKYPVNGYYETYDFYDMVNQVIMYLENAYDPTDCYNKKVEFLRQYNMKVEKIKAEKALKQKGAVPSPAVNIQNLFDGIDSNVVRTDHLGRTIGENNDNT